MVEPLTWPEMRAAFSILDVAVWIPAAPSQIDLDGIQTKQFPASKFGPTRRALSGVFSQK
jgi:hypothetical protein